MKRRLIAAALVLIFPFGMAACGSQSKAAACREIDNAVTSANKQAERKGRPPAEIRRSSGTGWLT